MSRARPVSRIVPRPGLPLPRPLPSDRCNKSVSWSLILYPSVAQFITGEPLAQNPACCSSISHSRSATCCSHASL